MTTLPRDARPSAAPGRRAAIVGRAVCTWLVLAGCAPTSSSQSTKADGTDAGHSSDAHDAVLGRALRGDLVFEVREPVAGPGEPIASFNYLCYRCGPDQVDAFDSAPLPSGFERAPWRETLATRSELRALPDAEGQPRALDILPSVDGAEFLLGAAPQQGTIVGGLAVLLDLNSDRTLEWDAGDEVHEITDGTFTYVAFLIERGTDPSSLEDLPLPAGFSHSVRRLAAPLVLDAHGKPHLFMALDAKHLWQRID